MTKTLSLNESIEKRLSASWIRSHQLYIDVCNDMQSDMDIETFTREFRRWRSKYPGKFMEKYFPAKNGRLYKKFKRVPRIKRTR